MFRLLLIVFSVLKVSAALRVGLLSSGDEEKSLLAECIKNTSVKIITIPACHSFNGVDNLIRLHFTNRVDAFIGAPCDKESETVSRLAFRWGVPYISTSARSSESREANTIAMVPDLQGGLASAVLAVLQEVGLQKVLIVFSEEFKLAADFLTAKLGQNAKTLYFSYEADLFWPHDVEVVLVLLNRTDRMHMLDELIRSNEIHSKLLVYDDGWSEPIEFYEDLYGLLLSSPNRQVVMGDFLVFQSHYGSEIRNYALNNNVTVSTGLENALLLCDILSVLDRANPKNLLKTFEQEYLGLTGPVLITENGSRQPLFNVFAWENRNIQLLLSVSPEVVPCNETSSGNCSTYVVVHHDSFSTVLLTLQSQDGSCKNCALKYALLAVLIVSAVVGVPLVAASEFQRREQKIHRMTWRIDCKSIVRSKKTLAEATLPGYRKVSSTSSAGLSSCFDSQQPSETSLAFLNDQKVFIKTFRQKRALTFTRAEIKHLDQLRNLSNSNLNPFIGISFNQGRELMVVWTYCPRSSLDYIIFEKERRFGRTFQCSFLKHILKGLEYIHGSSIKFHGSLFLSNCVVDANWVVKLTDFGLQEIIWDKMLHKELSCFRGVDVERLPLKYLQLPPEMLRNVLAEGLLGSGSAKADVYQLGMIVYQILFHAKPYADKSGLTTKELASIICDRFGDRTDQPFYPTVAEQHEYTTRLLSVMQQCWARDVEVRPELYMISDAVAREFESEGKGNVIDQMVRIIDDYSENLESMVSQRTKTLEASLVQTENLLFHIMPRNVAENLRMGLPIRSEMHPSVSLLVTDICKYTELCEATIPVQVIDILQDLYSSFDRIVSQYQAFKVENVGDLYLLASGLDHVPNHLCEVCRLSLKLLDFVEHYDLKHPSKFKLAVKIGIHSGSVASGILGSSAPRFCIFGDTVNMACRMANSSEPNKIQMTESIAQNVRLKYPGFIIEERGSVNVKGKGPVFTCYLTGCIGSRQPSESRLSVGENTMMPPANYFPF